MTKLGGYKLIDFGGVDISTSKTIVGIYNEITNTNKRIVVSNVKLGTTIFKEMVVDVFMKTLDKRLYLTNSIIKIVIGKSNEVSDEVICFLYGLENYNISYDISNHKVYVDGKLEVDSDIRSIDGVLRGNGVYSDTGSLGGITCESEDDGHGVYFNTENISMSELPTTDPQNEGYLWNDNGTLKISSGE